MSQRKAPDVRPHQPFDEDRLRSIFARVEPPARLAAGWHEAVATLGDAPARGRAAAPDAKPASRSWAHGLAAGVAALALGGGVATVISVNRPPSPEPGPAIIETITPGPTWSGPPPPSSDSPPESPPSPATPGGGQPPVGQPPGGTRPGATPPPAPPAAAAPDPGPLTGWPSSINVGVPAGTRLGTKTGDLHITTAGAVVSDLRVDGAIFVEAPDVTLRRVLVSPPSGAAAAIVQRAPRLTVEHSELTGNGDGIRQEAPGLTVRRSDVHTAGSAILAGTDLSIVDSYLHSMAYPLYTKGNCARIVVRHNTVNGSLTLSDDGGPVTGVTIDDNQLQANVAIWAPRGAGSHDIQVTGNEFVRGTTPASGWNAQAPGNAWTGNVWSDNRAPVTP
jgi:hypothetical protein